MRVLFTSYPEKTHLLAMVPLAWALRTAGHEVRFASQPRLLDAIHQAGLTSVPVGSKRDLWQILGQDPNWFEDGQIGLPRPYDVCADPELGTWERLRSGYEFQTTRWHKPTNVPMTADLVAFARHWRPDLVIWEPTSYAGAIAAKASGAAHARLLFGLDIFGVTRDRFLGLARQRPPTDRSDPIAEWLDRYATHYGSEFSEDMITGHFSIDQLPPSLRMPADLRYLPMRYVPYGGAAVIPKWLREPPARPRIALTLGLSAVDHMSGYAVSVSDILDALADLDVEVVATVPDEARPHPVPDNARVVPYVPLQALVPTCAAVIHHGGFGTLSTTALAGVPQLVLPWDSEEPLIADRLAKQGSTLAIPAGEASGQTVRDGLSRVLGETSFREGADRFREELLAMPTPAHLVPRLERLVDEFRGGAGR